ncbi:endonuclease [Paenibacillus zeisoli]|uniref:Endonuclease n=1 Tax=Paenibacillus zeisoli TaxID=2496267 RepID=A0A433XHZ1_9BACL|nr:immunoglobulin-like domain-containing protein [Paenibacillus zeisoli]RUT33690.1 endonuclease [Paenibacillus zeisoli]
MFNLKNRLLSILLATTIALPVLAGFSVGIPVIYAEGSADPAPVVNPVGVPNGKKVLFDNTHGQTAGDADWVIDGGFSDFGNALANKGYYVKELRKATPITLSDLEQYDAFVIGEANIPYKTSEQDAMLQYVQNGGSIFFIADHYNADRNKNRWDASEVMNGYRRGAWDNPAKGMTAEEAASSAMQGVESSDWLAQNFGVRFRYNALGDITTGDIIVPPDQSFGITAGVTNVAMHAGSTLAILDPTKAKGLVYVPLTNNKWASAVDQGVYNGGGVAEGPFSAIAKVGAGKAAFLGDSSPVEDATPKYLKEENGAVKTTYDGFKEEQDAAYLTQVMDWLTTKESMITSLDQYPSLELDQPTALLPMEDPASSVEPQAEPWAQPVSGYKWYDSTTFKAGSYGAITAVTNPTYSFISQNPLPSNEQAFQIRIVVDNLAPFASLTNVNLGLYNPSGGAQLGMISMDGGVTYPITPAYSGNFTLAANAKGHAEKDVWVKIKGTPASANVRVRTGITSMTTKTVPASATATPQPLPPNIPETSLIAEARSKPERTTVSIEGVVTTSPGIFGGQSFYLQDNTGGMYISQNTAGFNLGDKVLVSGDLATNNGQLELTSINYIQKTGTGVLPTPSVVAGIDSNNQGQLVQFDQVKIQNITSVSPDGSFDFDEVDANHAQTRVRVDARTGLTRTVFEQSYAAGDTVNISGVSSIDGTTFLLKPRGLTDFTLVSKAITMTDEEAVANALQHLEIGYANLEDEDHVTQDVTLPAMGDNGTTMTWESDKPQTMDAAGQVVRPSYSTGDVTVKLTATVVKGNATDTKTFTLKVLRLNQSDAEAVAEAAEALKLSYALNDSAQAVTHNVGLPTNGILGTTVSWLTDTPERMTDTGVISRPAFGQGNRVVTLTATIQRGSVQLTKDFVVTVLEWPAEASANKLLTLAVDGYAGVIDEAAKKVTITVPSSYSATEGVLTFTHTGVEARDNNMTTITSGRLVPMPFPEGTSLTIVSENGESAVYTLSVVKEPSVTMLTANPTTVAIVAGASATPVITAHYNNQSTTDVTSKVSWSSEDEEIASVVHGVVTGKSAGSTSVKAVYGGQYVDIPVTVDAAPTSAGGGDNSSGSSNSGGGPVVSAPAAPGEGAPDKGVTDPVTTEHANQQGVFKSEVVKEAADVVRKIAVHVQEAKSNPSALVVTDSKGHWAEKTIDTLVRLNIIQGYEDKTVKPNESITRAEFVTVLSRIFDVSEVKQVNLRDIGNHWASQAIKQFAAAGVISGYGDGSFQPDKPISREEIIVIIARMVNMDHAKRDSSKGNFMDVGSSYAKDAIQSAAEAGIIEGKDKVHFDPKSKSTRAEALQVVLNMLNLDPEIKTLLSTMQ